MIRYGGLLLALQVPLLTPLLYPIIDSSRARSGKNRTAHPELSKIYELNDHFANTHSQNHPKTHQILPTVRPRTPLKLHLSQR